MGFVGGSSGDKLMEELSRDIANSKSARVIVPVSHIYLEHQMTLILQQVLQEDEFKKIKEDKHFGFKKKLERVKTMELLSEDEYHDLDLINDTRNDFVHEFKPDLDQITKRIFQMKFHVFNEKRNPVEAILYDMIQLMSNLDQKIENLSHSHFQENIQPKSQNNSSSSRNSLQYCTQQFWLL